jgi:hypothetical protein
MLDIYRSFFLYNTTLRFLHLVSYVLKPCLHLQQSLCFSHGQHVNFTFSTFMVSSNYSYDVACFIFSFIILKRIKALGANDTIFMNCFHEVLLLPVHEFLSFLTSSIHNTHALSSNLMYEPSALLTSYVQQLQLKQLLLTLPLELYL